MKRASGMTLLEVMIAAGIAAAVMAVAVSVINPGVRVASLNEQTSDSTDTARLAADRLVNDLRQAGSFGGVFVTPLAGPPLRINSMFTFNSAATPTTDALWLIVPSKLMMQSDCARTGSAAVVTQASSTGQPLQVNCTAPLGGAKTLLVTNFNKAAALISVASTTSTSISYNEAGVVGFSNNPGKGFFQRGDFVVPVDLVRYEITTVAGAPQLTRSVFDLDGATVAAATPFGTGPLLRAESFPDIEDLQVAWGTGLSPATVFTSLHGATYLGGQGGNFGSQGSVPTSVRINVVGRTRRALRNDTGGLMPFQPMNVEDHTPAAVIDGYRRTLYRRRVELLNVGTLNL